MKSTPMKRGFAKCITLLSIFSLFLAPTVSSAASARTTQMSSAKPMQEFRGSKLELVAYLVPQVLERAGQNVRVADPTLVKAMKSAFRDSSAFVWNYAMVRPLGNGLEVSVALPSDEAHLRAGTLALGLIQDGKLAGAYILTLNRDAGQSSMSLSLTRPDGSSLSQQSIALSADGRMQLTPAQVKAFASAMAINTQFGLLEKLIAILEQVQDLLYWVRDIINMAICVVDEVIELAYDWMGCGVGTTGPGGGAILDVVVCSVGATIETVNEIFARCL